jgi:hypothetical protein
MQDLDDLGFLENLDSEGGASRESITSHARRLAMDLARRSARMKIRDDSDDGDIASPAQARHRVRPREGSYIPEGTVASANRVGGW